MTITSTSTDQNVADKSSDSQTATDSPLAIRAESIAKTYTPSSGDPVTALTGVNLQIRRGEIYALLGPNGAGKTTLISILTTLLLPSHGVAQVAGFDVVTDPAQVRRRIGVTFQETVLDLQLTGRQVLAFHGRLYGLASDEIAIRIRELADLVELTEALDRKVNSYSGGMKRRLELIRGLLTRPEILFLDEPTQGLDPQNRAAIWQYLQQLRRDFHLTILLTTHYMEEAEFLADRVGIITRGALAREGTPAALSAELGQDVIVLSGSGDPHHFAQHLRAQSWVDRVSLPQSGVDALPAAGAVAPTEASPPPVHILQIGVAHGARYLAPVVELATAANFQIQDLSVKRPTLGDVFLAVTGAALPRE